LSRLDISGGAWGRSHGAADAPEFDKSSSQLISKCLKLCKHSHGLLEFENEFVHRFVGRWLDREITGVLWMSPEVAFGNEPETGSLDLTAQRTLLDAMQGLAD
jgi:hypothetical protein